jgi:hypothetical protein
MLCSSSVEVAEDEVVFRKPKGRCDAPVVAVLFGWAGSKHKHLRHVERFYRERLQYSTVCHIMPLYSSQDETRAYTQQIMQKIRDSGARKKVAHIFSNNGTWSYARLQQMHSDDGDDLPLMDRVVYDSAPMLWREQPSLLQAGYQYSRAILPGILNRAQYEHPVLTPVVTLALAARVAWQRATEEDVLLQLNRFLLDASPTVPHLFLHSSGDKLITPAHVGEFQDSMRKRGASIEHRMWGEEVSHCAAMMKHPKEYTSIVANFVGELDEE